VELKLGAARVMLGRPGETYVNPKRLREQCDAEAGAELLSEIEDGPDGRLYSVEDREGYRWMFAQA
jgi:uncharacterized glyoxalase superfamily protein PhnB